MLLTLVLLIAIHFAVSFALTKRVFTPVVDDGIILNYVLTIEYLQLALYRDTLAQFGRADFQAAGFPDPFYDSLLAIYSDELNQISVLSDALLAVSIPPTVSLEYIFPMMSFDSSVTLASVFSGLATSAYVSFRKV